MLGAVRTASRRLHAVRLPPLSTPTDGSSTPLPHHESPPISTSGAGRERGGMLQGVHPRMIFVRPWDGIPTMAHAFAIVREIERRFGRIQEFVVVRDSDVHSSCSPFLHATFSKEKDAAAIPLDGKVIQVKAPDVDGKRDGGIGLDDLHVYLNPETREQALLDRESVTEKEREWGPPEGEVIDVKLERTGLRDPPPVLEHSFGFGRRGPPHVNNPIRTQELAHAIHAFGGFVDRPSPTQGRQTPMEAIVSRWSRMVKQPPRPPPVPPENVVDKNLTEKSEEPPALEEKEIPWTSFETETVAPSLLPPSALPSPLPVTPPKPSLTPQPQPQPQPQPEPNKIPAEPKISRKQRMLNAARLAGAMAVEKPPGTLEEPVDAHPQTNSRVPNAGAEQTPAELDHDSKISEEENKVTARRWWKFLTGGN